MENYYDLLEIDISAGLQELERAWEEKYNKARRLITHHDPQVVEEANHQIRILENARQILFDPTKRAEYTARLSGQGIAGLGDPTAQGAAPAVSTPYSGAVGNSNAVTTPKRLDAWICDNCQEENTVGTKFCSECGESVGERCLNCQHLNKVNDPFCSNCGGDLKEFELILREKKQALVLQEIESIKRQIENERSEIEQFKRVIKKLIVINFTAMGRIRNKAIRDTNFMKRTKLGCLPIILCMVMFGFAGLIGDEVGSIILLISGLVIGIFGSLYMSRKIANETLLEKINNKERHIISLKQNIRELQTKPIGDN